MDYYRDLREYLSTLEEKGKLVRMSREINKDTELHPLVRWQFRGLPEEQRKAFLFEKVTDAKKRAYDIPVLVAAHAASDEVYALGMMCSPEQISEKWTKALLNPVEPRLVDSGPVHEVVMTGEELTRAGGGLEKFPIPISTPGFDNAPYTTASCWVTKDPDTGQRNMGVYRGMVKSRTRIGVCVLPTQHIAAHWKRCLEKGIPMEAAAVIGAAPCISYCAVSKVPHGVDEYAVAGGIAGAPIELVKCKTVDIEVPASAEIVLEGKIPTEYLEREAPFGEFTGYMGNMLMNCYMDITCITHRQQPIYTSFISQFCPSESSKLKQKAWEPMLYKFLRYDCNIPTVLDVALYEISGCWNYGVIKMKKDHPAQPWQALFAINAFDPALGKTFIVVDEDIDARDSESVIWALSYRMRPGIDTHITTGKASSLDFSATPPGELSRAGSTFTEPSGRGSLLIDATRKYAYTPVALPEKQFMERARRIWEEEGLPKLKPRVPWHGYNLGFWTSENEEEAKLALKGDHFKTGEKLAGQRIKATLESIGAIADKS
jgi:4-hydroxy-3-polyprenylbenzoate decarboxylase